MLIELRLEPTIATLGPVSLGWHGLLTAVAVAVAVRFGLWSAQRTGHPVAALWSVMTWATVGGLIGARTFYVIDHGPTYLKDPLGALAVWQGGIAVYGAFIGGIAAGVLAARREGLQVWPLLDAAAPAMLVGQAIGRLGCLINGDTWGAPTGAEWGLVYWNPGALLPSALLGVPTHAYPIYEIAAALTLLALLLWLLRWPMRHGHLFLLAVAGYAAIRFALTSFRQEAIILGGLQQAQLVALLSGLAAFAFLLLRSRTRQHDEGGNLRSST